MITNTSMYEYATRWRDHYENWPALSFYGRTMTYRELYRRIDCAADRLYELGVRMGDVVTLHLPNCPQLVIVFYALAKIGAICSMTHPQLPLQGLKQHMEFTESRILVTGNHFEDCDRVDFAALMIFAQLDTHMGFVAATGFRWKNRARRPEGAVPFKNLEQEGAAHALLPDQKALADVCGVYLPSSGTVGKPKTVMHTHRSINELVEGCKSLQGIDGWMKHKSLAVLPFFHGYGLAMSMHRDMVCGGEQFLMAKWDRCRGVRLIEKEKIDMIIGVPALYQGILDEARVLGADISSLRECYVGGDRVPMRLKQEFDRIVGVERCIFEGYGMAEIVGGCFSTGLRNRSREASGYPMSRHCRIAILDDHGRPAKVGQGELIVSTPTMMIGYLKEPEETARSFLEWDGCNWFRTGDFGWVDEEGYLYFKERTAHTFVRKGYNIYPGEIEAVVRRVEEVIDVCVIGHRDEQTEVKEIIACVVTGKTTSRQTVEKKISQICGEYLPKYSWPREIRFLDELPRNRMSKIDRMALERML